MLFTLFRYFCFAFTAVALVNAVYADGFMPWLVFANAAINSMNVQLIKWSYE